MSAATAHHSDLQVILQPRIIACVAGAYPNDLSHALDTESALDVLRITKTRALIIHVASRMDLPPKCCIPITEVLRAFDNLDSVVPMVNTSRAATSTEAASMIRGGLGFVEGSGLFRRPALIKLEILDRSLLCLQDEILDCIESLPAALQVRCIPFLPPNRDVAVRARELGCPAVRIMAGRIGERSGIPNLTLVSDIIGAIAPTPVILEGGIDSAQDIFDAATCGASAVLVNSAFALARDARAKASELRAAADMAWAEPLGGKKCLD